MILGGAAMWGLFYEFYEQDQILATYERTQGKIQLKINGGWKEGVVDKLKGSLQEIHRLNCWKTAKNRLNTNSTL